MHRASTMFLRKPEVDKPALLRAGFVFNMNICIFISQHKKVDEFPKFKHKGHRSLEEQSQVGVAFHSPNFL